MKKGHFQYDGKSLSITDALKEPGVSKFLQRNGPLKNGPLRNKLRRLFKVGVMSKGLVDRYLREARAGNRNPYIILPQRKGAIEINGEKITVRQVLNRFPLLRGYLQQKKFLVKSRYMRSFYGNLGQARSLNICYMKIHHNLI